MRHALAATLTLAAALAAGQARANPDANGDGLISYPELATVVEIDRTGFDALDTNGDGGLDGAEVAAAQAAGKLPQPL